MTVVRRHRTSSISPASGYRPYEPLHSPKKMGPDLWIVDGPILDYSVACLCIPCPTRMTVARLRNGALWVHSPIEPDAALAGSMARLGQVEILIAPNTLHYKYVEAWNSMHPKAKVYAPRRLLPRLKGSPAEPLTAQAPPGYADEIDQVLIELPNFAEAIFFHRASSTLIVTDLMQRFEKDRFSSPFIASVMKCSGATGPSYAPSIELRYWARRHKALIAETLERIRAWAPKRVVMSHGRVVRKDAAAQIDGAFAWVTS